MCVYVPVFGKSTAFEWSCASSRHWSLAGPEEMLSAAARCPFAICYELAKHCVLEQFACAHRESFCVMLHSEHTRWSWRAIAGLRQLNVSSATSNKTKFENVASSSAWSPRNHILSYLTSRPGPSILCPHTNTSCIDHNSSALFIATLWTAFQNIS